MFQKVTKPDTTEPCHTSALKLVSFSSETPRSESGGRDSSQQRSFAAQSLGFALCNVVCGNDKASRRSTAFFRECYDGSSGRGSSVVEQPIRNRQVASSTLALGSSSSCLVFL